MISDIPGDEVHNARLARLCRLEEIIQCTKRMIKAGTVRGMDIDLDYDDEVGSDPEF